MRATERLCGFLHVVHDWAGLYHESQADREEDADRHRLDNTEMRLRPIDWGPQQVDSSTRHGDEDRQTGEDDQSDERPRRRRNRSEEHTSELQSLMRISYAVFCLKQKIQIRTNKTSTKRNTN